MSVYFRTHFLETISGLCTIRAFGCQHSSQRSHEALLQAAQRPYYQRFMVQRWLNLVLDMVAAGVAILVVGLAIRLQTRSTLVGLALVNVISERDSAIADSSMGGDGDFAGVDQSVRRVYHSS
ncbi:hypothetical protein BO99DRAFT_12245 [Aspergillus violaceofuscus CBS 115571]|uniref:ABC transmembrane type-1 domain-containing protein n=1 Tax=Aspergillus violaceofuscus (strain CBS 115571) TaxID=1450538 RepID=A0A2V5HS94_ASPV1|nr:hypothetical protein BO99DRAFT_12245 [Aspergillus violaceofuscus CBS 115571]